MAQADNGITCSTAAHASPAEGRFQVAVGAVIEHVPTGRVLVIKRAPSLDLNPGDWEIVVGRMKQFEELEGALQREIREETGLEVQIVKPLRAFHFFRHKRTAENELVGIIYWCKCESDAVTLSNEHTGYRWLQPEEACKFVTNAAVRRDIETFMQERCHTPLGPWRNPS